MPDTLDGALQRAYLESLDPSQPPPRRWQGLCQMFVRTCWDVAPRYGDAANAWKHAAFQHTTGTPPVGAPIFWTGGSQGFGHVALSVGNGACWSTDILRTGYPDRVTIDLIDRAWGNLHRVGWTEDINDVRVITVGSGEGGGVPIPPEPPEQLEEEDDAMFLVHRADAPSDTQFWLVVGGKRIYLNNWTNVKACLDAGVPNIALKDVQIQKFVEVR